jgi:hypothetical protein
MSDEKTTEENATEDNIQVGNYVITKDSLGLVVGKSSDENWVIEWPIGSQGEVEYMKHSNDDIVVINLEDN